jgi:RNA polymerase sigma-70 factor (ECF subfamily)
MLSTFKATQTVEVDEPADEHLVALAQGGDSSAFERLAKRHREGTYRLALRIVSRPEDAEDVVQDVWLSIYTHIGGFRAESSFQTWIHRIAYNRSLQIRRFQGRSALDLADGGFDDDGTLLLAAREQTPEDSAILSEQRATLGALIGKLADKYRRALCLWAFDSKDIEQMSRELRISYGAAKTRLHRARLQFQQAARKSESAGLPPLSESPEAERAATPPRRRPRAARASFSR